MWWSTIVRFAGGSLFKYAATGLAGIALAIAGAKVISHYNGLVETKSKYEQAQLTIDELQSANESLVERLTDQESRHNEEVARLNLDREALDKKRFEIQKAAFIENGKLKKKLEENEDAKNWYDSALPDSIKQLRNGGQEAEQDP